ncbi:MAG: DegT/DnrJ/EryC1/StrS aminotransferase family protein [Gammaproteobacteria bacterium]|nr:DegT/DnrJ/EryC1/StrS aminotransferase family protein [Gammaproteobacteria bacterium]
MNKRIPLLVPYLPTTQEILPYLQRIDQAKWYTNFGPLVRELERRILAEVIGQYNDKFYFTTVNNCTLGLELALQTLHLPTNSKVLIPALTFVATASAVIRAGHQPILADINLDSWLLTEIIAKKAAEKMRIDAVMPVATYGCPQDICSWEQFIEDTGIPVIIDAAGAFGNQNIGQNVDVVFSFHATKSFGIGEGGGVFSGSQSRICEIRQLSNFGIDTISGIVYECGTNAKMSEFQAAIALAALDKWPMTKCKLKDLYKEYVQILLSYCDRLTFQNKPQDGIYPIFPLALPEGIDPNRVAAGLANKGVETRRWYYPPLYEHQALTCLPKADDLSTVKHISSRILGLPFHASLSCEDMHFISKNLQNFINDK